MGWQNMFDSENEYIRRNMYPAELREIAQAKLSGKGTITQEEIYDFLIDLYLYEQSLKKPKGKKKARRCLVRSC